MLWCYRRYVTQAPESIGFIYEPGPRLVFLISFPLSSLFLLLGCEVDLPPTARQSGSPPDCGQVVHESKW